MKRTLVSVITLCLAVAVMTAGCASADGSAASAKELDTGLIFGLVGAAGFLGLAVKDFLKSDWGIRKEWLNSENRSKLQKRKAFLELGFALFGAISMLSFRLAGGQTLSAVSGIATLVVFVLYVLNGKKKN